MQRVIPIHTYMCTIHEYSLGGSIISDSLTTRYYFYSDNLRRLAIWWVNQGYGIHCFITSLILLNSKDHTLDTLPEVVRLPYKVYVDGYERHAIKRGICWSPWHIGVEGVLNVWELHPLQKKDRSPYKGISRRDKGRAERLEDNHWGTYWRFENTPVGVNH